MFKNYHVSARSTLLVAWLTILPLCGLIGCAPVGKVPAPADSKPASPSVSTDHSRPAPAALGQDAVAKYKKLAEQAMTLEGSQHIAEAIPLMKQAIDIKKKGAADEELGHFYGNLAWAYLSLKKYKEAEAAYHQALKYIPADSKIAKDYQHDCDYASGQLLRTNPQSRKDEDQSRALAEAGFAAGKAKDFGKAVEQFQKSIQARHGLPEDDELAQLYGNLGWAYMSAKNWAKAEQAYGKALEIASPNCASRKLYEHDKLYTHDQGAAQSRKK